MSGNDKDKLSMEEVMVITDVLLTGIDVPGVEEAIDKGDIVHALELVQEAKDKET